MRHDGAVRAHELNRPKCIHHRRLRKEAREAWSDTQTIEGSVENNGCGTGDVYFRHPMKPGELQDFFFFDVARYDLSCCNE